MGSVGDAGRAIAAGCGALFFLAACRSTVEERAASAGATDVGAGAGPASTAQGSGGIGAGGSSSSTGVTECVPGVDGCPLWAERFGGVGDELTWCSAADAEGNVYVGGSFEGAIDFGGGPLTAPKQAMYVVKLGPEGGFRWAKALGHNSTIACGMALGEASGDLYFATGSPGADFDGGPVAPYAPFVARLTPEGSVVWAHSVDLEFGGFPGAWVAVDPSENVFVATGALDVPLLSYDALGNARWSIGTPGELFWAGSPPVDALSGSVAAGKDGSVLLAVDFDDWVDFGLGPNRSHGGFDFAVARYAGDGTLLWTKTFGGPGDDLAISVTIGADGNTYISGLTDGADFGGGAVDIVPPYGGFVLELDESGNHVASFPIECEPFAVVRDTLGQLAVVGHGLDVSGTANTLFVSKRTASGQPVWTLNAVADGFLTTVAPGPDGTIGVAGRLTTTVDFGLGPLPTAGLGDVIVARFGP